MCPILSGSFVVWLNNNVDFFVFTFGIYFSNIKKSGTNLEFGIMKISQLMVAGAVVVLSQGTEARLLNAQEPEALPRILLCSVADRVVYAYLSSIESDGSARYVGLAGGVAVVNPEGRVEPTSTMKGGDCAGRTIAELRADGKTIEIPQ